MAKANKYTYLKVLQFNGGNYWEDIDETEDPQEAKRLMGEYRMAFHGQGALRVVNRRELNKNSRHEQN